jgi:hypothetical protein
MGTQTEVCATSFSQHYWLFLSIGSPYFRLKIRDNTFIMGWKAYFYLQF